MSDHQRPAWLANGVRRAPMAETLPTLQEMTAEELAEIRGGQTRDPGAGGVWGTDPGAGIGAFLPGMGPGPAAVQLPGGDLLTKLLHPESRPFERMRRVLPEDSWFDAAVTPRSPIQFEIDAFAVPKGTMYLMFSYRFTPYRFSGVDPGDIIPVESGRFSNLLGFDLLIDGQRMGNVQYGLDPVPVTLQRRSFAQPAAQRATAAQFDAAAANSFATTSGQGLGLLPARSEMMGAEGGPFTLIARETQRVSLSCVIFRPIPIPLGAMESRHAGFLVQTQLAEVLINRLRLR